MENFQIGAILRKALQVGRANLLSFAILGLIVYSPYILRVIAWVGENSISDIPEPGLDFHVLTLFTSQILAGMIAYITVCTLQGRPVTLSKCLHVGISRMFPIVAVGLVSSLALLAITFLPILIVPALFITTMLYVAIPVAVIEQPGFVQTLQRSAELTYGRRWMIFGILILTVVVVLIGAKVLNVLWGHQDANPSYGYLANVLGLQLCIVVFSDIIAAVLYFRLSASK